MRFVHNCGSQPDLLAPLATSTRIHVDSDVNMEDSDPFGEVNVVDPTQRDQKCSTNNLYICVTFLFKLQEIY